MPVVIIVLMQLGVLASVSASGGEALQGLVRCLSHSPI